MTDQGYSFGSTTDERGAPRPYDFISIPTPGGDGSDIGAFELGSSDLGLDVVRTTWCSPGPPITAIHTAIGDEFAGLNHLDRCAQRTNCGRQPIGGYY